MVLTVGGGSEFASSMCERSQRREVGESRHHSTAAHAVSLLCPGKAGCPEAAQGLGSSNLISVCSSMGRVCLWPGVHRQVNCKGLTLPTHWPQEVPPPRGTDNTPLGVPSGHKATDLQVGAGRGVDSRIHATKQCQRERQANSWTNAHFLGQDSSSSQHRLPLGIQDRSRPRGLPALLSRGDPLKDA